MQGVEAAPRSPRGSVWSPLAIGVGVAALVLALSALGALGWARWRLYDVASVLAASAAPDPHIAIVGITDSDLAAYGRWPWPRSVEARLVDRLHADGARVIALDLLLPEASTPAQDQALAAASRRAGNVIFASYATLGPRAAGLPAATAVTQPVAVLRAAGAVGLVNALPASDGVLRRAIAAVRVKGRVMPSLDLLAAAALSGRPARVDAGAVSLGAHRLHLLPGGGYLVDYVAPSSFPVVSVGDVLAGRVGASLLAGRVVLVGAWAAGLGDRWLTPIGGPWPGVLIHAESIHTLLDGGLVLPGAASTAAAVLAAALAGALLFAWVGPWVGMAVLAGLALAVLVWAALSLAYGVAVDAAGPLAALVLTWAASLAWGVSAEQRARVRITTLFGRHVGPDVVQSLMAMPAGGPATAGDRLPVTVLFLDMRGFTALAAARSPETVVALLNRVFDAVVPLVLESGGMLDKFVGDGLMALWNVPSPMPDHAVRAVGTALAMQRRLADLNEQGLGPRGAQLGFGIGIDTGEAVVGTVGTHSRQEYTAIGDTVNLAARLQEQAGAGEVLVSAATWSACQDAQTGLAAEPRVLAIRGRSEPLQVFVLRPAAWAEAPAQAARLALPQ